MYDWGRQAEPKAKRLKIHMSRFETKFITSVMDIAEN